MVRGVQKTKKQIQQKTNHGVVYGQEKDHDTTFDPGGDKVLCLEKDLSTFSVISIERDNFDYHFLQLT